jgi:DNA-binding response OmpR family regulator
VLDLMLPGPRGLEICKEVRSFSELPVIMVTARVEEVDALSASRRAPMTTCASPSACASWWRG